MRDGGSSRAWSSHDGGERMDGSRRLLAAFSRNLRDEVAKVVSAGNCSGCGACATISPAIGIELDASGFTRPRWIGNEPSSADQARQFRSICPGVTVRRSPVPGARRRTNHVLGSYVSIWTAWASDPEVRWRGSSAGVLTALTSWLVEEQGMSPAVGAGMSASRPTRTVPVRLTSRDEALAAAGSRYAPVGTAALFEPQRASVLIGKPCEAAAARRMVDSAPPDPAGGPVVLSFFCAGVPSQKATDDLVAELGMSTDDVAALWYRGRGWPGHFVVEGRGGDRAELSYEESWGRHLGPTVQSRCKICPDGTGGEADIAVGDFWRADSAGYPVFEDSDGLSVAIARTPRGHRLLLEAAAAGVVTLHAASPDEVVGVQPLQRRRVEELPGRLLGRLLAGRRVPRYRGFGLVMTALRAPVVTLRAARGSFARARSTTG